MATAKREKFGSRIAVIFAMAGSAIGLGNLWRFPYLAGEQGGAAFVFIYIAATLFISLPVFISEVIIGRRSRSNASDAMIRLAPDKKFWRYIKYLPVIIPTIIASYYSVIGGWSLDFMFRSCALQFTTADPAAVSSVFGELISSPWRPLVMHLIFLVVSTLIVAGGVKSGIEKFSKWSLPLLFVLIVVIAVYSICLPGASAGVDYLLKPDFSSVTPSTFAYAMGQSFYSLSLGMGTIITYGSYVSKKDNILGDGAASAGFDLFFALLAGLAVMPAVFAAGIEPGSGPGLIFQSIPYVFAKMGETMPVLSAAVAILFFLTVVVAAMTSLISLIEVGVAFLMEKFGLSRSKSCLVVFVICAVLGSLCAVEGSVLDFLDWSASNILLILMAFLVVLFVGFVMKKEDVKAEFTNNGELSGPTRIFPVYYFLLRWIAPIAILLIFVSNFIL